ncbi:MAG: putative baseplate assembly protein [Blastocatellia bacterium]
MPILNPILDDRSYQQLRDELVRRIPVYTPEWTDHNASDPGVTLIELFAFLGENLLYRFNQIPETARLEFLRLLQIPLRPATPARALVVMTTDKLTTDAGGNPTGTLVPLGAELRAGNQGFETITETRVWPLSTLAMGRIATPAPKAESEAAEDAETAIQAASLKPGQTPVYYQSQPVDLTQPPVDFSAAVDGMLWVALLLKKPPRDETAYNEEKKKYTGALLNLGFAPDFVFDAMDATPACPGAGATGKPPAVEWQVSTGRIEKTSAADPGQPQYRRLTVEGDRTRGLSQEGVVRFRLPASVADFGRFTLPDEDLAGTGQFPPLLEEKDEQRLLCWIRVFRHDGSRFGRVAFVGLNAAETQQTRRARPEFLGVGTAQPDQRFRLVNQSVIASSVRLDVEEGTRWVEWTEVENFYASQPDDRHYRVDPEAGEIRFGNGLQGLPPQIGQRIRVREYRYGGGAAGNVAPKAISKLTEFADVKVENPLRARGGADAEPIREAMQRIPGELRRRDRAVTATDFRELALMTPGAEVGRAECLARFHPPTRQDNAAGVVSVVIWPRADAAHPNAPLPDRALLRLVCEWLDPRRLITTELYVIPPTYHRVAVAIGLEIKPGYGIEAVRHWVELVIRQYLAPLPPYGPEGQGWPLGRRVHGPELEAAALQVEGVQFLNDLKVAGWNEATQTWTQGTVIPEQYEVPELVEITVVEGPLTIEPGQAVQPSSDVAPIPIPAPRHEC